LAIDLALLIDPALAIVATTCKTDATMLATVSITAWIVARSFPPTKPVELKTGNSGKPTAWLDGITSMTT
jgi:hypothetical protein